MKKYKICDVPIEYVHEKLFELLVEFDRICKKNNIRYTLEGGTLLGADKYKDFVPWDDDIDIVMLRKDYEKFLSACKVDLAPQFFLQNNETDERFPLNYSKLRMNNTVYCQKNYDFLDIHQGIFIDIFQYDYAFSKTKNMKCHLLGALNGAKSKKLEVILSEYHYYEPVSLVKKIVYTILSVLPLKTLNYLIRNVIKEKREGKFLYNFTNPLYNAPLIPAERFNKYTEVEFHGAKFYAVAGYKQWLKEVFGDYMNEEPDEEIRGPSHAITECYLGKISKEKNIGILIDYYENDYGKVLSAYAVSHFISKELIDNDINANCEIINTNKSLRLLNKRDSDFIFHVFSKIHLQFSNKEYKITNAQKLIDDYNILLYDDTCRKHVENINFINGQNLGHKIYNISANDNLNCDPMFLLSRDYYSRIESRETRVKGEYLLLYGNSFSDNDISVAKKIAAAHNLKLVYIGSDTRVSGFLKLKKVFVPQFLTLIKNSRVVITNIFYGFAFSMLYNVEAYYTGNSKKIGMLADCLGVSKYSLKNYEIICDPIKWSVVNRKIDLLVQPLRDYIKDCVLNDINR